MADDNTTGLNIPIGADPSDLRRGMQEAERIIESSSQRIRSSVERIGNLGQQLAGLGATLTASLTLPIVGLATASIQAYGDIQALQKGLEAVTGSAQKANDEFTRLKEVAKLPGIGLNEAVKGSINLQSIGLSARTSRDILLQFGNAIATVGKGRVEFERAIYGVTQLANTSFPLGEDLNIIADALPQVRTLLQDTFGATRSDDLAKMGVSSKQVLDAILQGLGKLPRVTGGIKNAFENLKDSMTISLGRIGKIIDDAFDIGSIVDKITGYVDKIVSAFESLDPSIQKIILVVLGLVAALGPLLVAVGGFMALLPVLTAGIAGIGTAFLAILTPVGLVTVALVGVVAAVVANWDKIRPYLEDTIDRFKRLWKESALFKASIVGLGASIEGFARVSLVVLEIFYKNFVDFGKAVLNIFKGIGEGIEGTLTFNASKILQGYNRVILAPIGFVRDMTKNSLIGLSDIAKVTDETIKRWKNINFDNIALPSLKKALGEDDDVDKLIPGIKKVKKETQKQLAEIYPVGSIAELRQRAALLVKAIETSNNDIIKIRGLDKFGKETNKLGLPVYTGEILSREKAVDRLADLNMLIGEELKPVDIKGKGFLNQFGEEFKSVNDLFFAETVRAGKILGEDLPNAIKVGVDKSILEAARLQELTKELNSDLSELISSSISSSINDMFSSIGEAIANGGNVMAAIGKSLLKSFGSFLSSMGKMLIEYGTLAVIKGTLDNVIKIGGVSAIAAGVAAIAVGAALSVAGSAIGTKASSGMDGGSISSSAGVSSQNFSSSNVTSGGGISGNEVVFRISGPDLIGTINRNVDSESRLNSN